MTASEALLLELGGTYFTSGFNNAHVDSGTDIAAFFASSLLVDAFVVLAGWWIALAIGRRLMGGATLAFFVVGLGLALPGLYDLARYQLVTVLGGAVSVRNLFELAGGQASAVATEVALQLEGRTGLALLALAAVLTLLLLAHTVDRRWPAAAAALREAPSLGALARGAGIAALLSLGVLALPVARAGAVQEGLLAKPGGRLLVELARRGSDVDRDGSGWLSRPGDPAAFDGDVHPFAIDRPGNGVDENGLAGDHPEGFEPGAVVPVPRESAGEARRHLLVIFLESFRGDLLERRVGDRAVTPFIDRLAREGGKSLQAFVHTPATVASRAQLFGGRLEWRVGGSTWVDDFQARGYRVAHFSGQDDTLSGSASVMGTDRADLFYDARSDPGKRTSRTRNALSLQVSWKTLAARVEAFLEEHDPREPLFLYVNLVDTHFPYHHDELDDIIGTTPVARHAIRRDRADAVRATYANAAANVDRGVERIVEAWWRAVGKENAGILLTADHGQSFYENGVLGHGQFLDPSHTRVPFVLWGIGGAWPEPLGLADVRGLVARHLSGSGVQPRFVPDPERWIFQFTPRLDRPRLIQLRGLQGTAAFDLESGESRFGGPLFEGGSGEARRARFGERVVLEWEGLRLRAAVQ